MTVDPELPPNPMDTSHTKISGITMHQSRQNNVASDKSESNSLVDQKDDCDSSTDMESKLNQLQNMVREMKLEFGNAVDVLARIQFDDQIIQERINSNKLQQENHLADVIEMVLSLKTEFMAVSNQLHAATDNQKRMERQIELLQYERDLLLEELHRHGVVSEDLRNQYHSGRVRRNNQNRSCDQTSLSIMLERAHHAFQLSPSHISDHDSGLNTFREPPELSSLGDMSLHGGDTHVHPYIVGLQDSLHQSLHNSLHERSLHDVVCEPYESDSSITAAANKSLDMSRSLGDKCAEITNLDSDWEEAGEREEEEDNSGKLNILDLTNSPRERSESQDNLRIVADENIKPVDEYHVFTQPQTPKRLAPHERNTKEVQRQRVAREIVETEKKYCSDIWTVIDLYMGPLQSTGILQPREASIMFPSSMFAIYDYHCEFLKKLEQRMSNWKYQSVLGDILCQFIESSECDLLHQYESFVIDFPASLGQIKKSCKNSPRFRKYLRMMQRHPNCGGLDIGSYMVTPIQRIPRYVLLLKQLLKNMDSDHPDYFHIETTLEHLGDFLNKLNESMEYSMQIVNTEDTPKVRRKRYMGSFRSLSMRSQDGSKVNDTSVHGDDNSVLSTSTSASHGRFFNFSFLRESFKRKRNSATVMNPPYENKTIEEHPQCYDESLATPRTAPVSVCTSQLKRTQQQLQIPQCTSSQRELHIKQGSDERFHLVMPDRRSPANSRNPSARSDTCYDSGEKSIPRNINSSEEEHDYVNGVLPNRAPVLTPHVVISGKQSRLSHRPFSEAMNDLPKNESQSKRHQHIGSLDYLPVLPNMLRAMPQSASSVTKSLPDVSRRNRPRRTNSRKLPVTPTGREAKRICREDQQKDFGIYGNNAGSDEDDTKLIEKRHSARMNREIRYVMNDSDAPDAHSQDYINAALAQSLVKNNSYCVSPHVSSNTPVLRNQNYSTLQPVQHSEDRPRSALKRNVSLPRQVTAQAMSHSESNKPDSSRKLTEASSLEDKSFIKLDVPITTKKDSTLKKNQIFPCGEKVKKRNSLKQSLKSIFTRRRGARATDLIPYDEYPENGHQIYAIDVAPSPSSSMLQLQTSDIVQSPKEQGPPQEKTLVLEPVEPQLETYDDEDGQPCSAV